MTRTACFLIAATITLSSCGSDAGESSRSILSEADRPVTERTAVIRGVYMHVGALPPPQVFEVASDPYCGDGGRISTIEVQDVYGENQSTNHWRVQDAFVWVSDGLDSARFDRPDDTVDIIQMSCRLTPRVVGVRAGQPVRFVNEDGTLMNVHARTAENGAFNIGLEEGGSEVVVFEKPELFVPIGSDIHAWMRSWIAVLDHPCFDVTNPQGEFSIDVPPGSYTISARHERLGTLDRTIDVRAGDTASIQFVFGK